MVERRIGGPVLARSTGGSVRAIAQIALIVTLLALAATTTSRAESSVHFLLGQKRLDSEDWSGGDDPTEIGLAGSFGGRNWPVHIAVDLLFAAEEVEFAGVVVGLDQWTFEVDVGVRKTFGRGRGRVFVGGGPAIVTGSRELLAVGGLVLGDEDTAVGLWANSGMLWRLGKGFDIGIEGRISRARIDLEPEVEAGGEHVALILGRGW
jgi:hypothetical protein